MNDKEKRVSSINTLLSMYADGTVKPRTKVVTLTLNLSPREVIDRLID